MKILERINRLGELFNSIRITKDIMYINVNFPDKWVIPTNLPSYFSGIKRVEKEGYQCFCAEPTYDVDILFDVVDYIVKFNDEIEKKLALYSIALKNLKQLFNQEGLEKLSTLQFVFAEANDDMEKSESVDTKKVDLDVNANVVGDTIKDSPTTIASPTKGRRRKKAISEGEEGNIADKQKDNIVVDTEE